MSVVSSPYPIPEAGKIPESLNNSKTNEFYKLEAILSNNFSLKKSKLVGNSSTSIQMITINKKAYSVL